MTETLLTLLKLSVGALILAIGMGSTFSDLAFLWRRPGLLLRSLLAMYVLVPLAAFLLVTLLPIAPGVKAALLVLAVSAGGTTPSAEARELRQRRIRLQPRGHLVAARDRRRPGLGRPARPPLRRGDRALTDGRCGRHRESLPRPAGDRNGHPGAAADVQREGRRPAAGDCGRGADGHRVGAARRGLAALPRSGLEGHGGARGPAADRAGDRACPRRSARRRPNGACDFLRHAAHWRRRGGCDGFRGPKTAVLIAAYVVASALVAIPYLRWRRRQSGVASGAAPSAS